MRLTFSAMAILLVTMPLGAQEPTRRYKVGDSFTQEVVVARRSAFRVLGIDVVKGAQYAFASTFEITKVNKDGSLEATQTIKTAKLIDADTDLRESLAAALAKTQGVRFDLKVATNGEVTDLNGLKNSIQVQIGTDKDVGASLRIWSVLDADAWKELGSRTFFVPDRPQQSQSSAADPPLKPWKRDAAHDWGALGSWKGKTVYTPGKKPDKAGLEHFQYGHYLTYHAPKAGSEGELPMKIIKSSFQIVTAGGVILYDPIDCKVAKAEEAFRVRGAVMVSLGGIEATIELEEQQAFRINIGETRDRNRRAK